MAGFGALHFLVAVTRDTGSQGDSDLTRTVHLSSARILMQYAVHEIKRSGK